MNSRQGMFFNLFASAVLLAVHASVASACSTCKLGRGMPDTYSNGLLQVGGVGADPLHAGVSFDPDDLRADMSGPANEETTEAAYVFGLNAGVQMNTNLDQSSLAPYDPLQIGAEVGADEWDLLNPSQESGPFFSMTGDQSGRMADVELAEAADLVIADPMDVDRHTPTFTLAPEPASLALFCLGLLSLRRRRGQ